MGYHRVSGQWNWTDGSDLDYENFQGESPDEDKHCVYWNDDKSWKYENCGSEYRALCMLSITRKYST